MRQRIAERLSVDRARCEGYGMCQETAPQLLHLNEEDEPVVDIDEISPAQWPLAEAAVRACPVAALSISRTPVP